MWLHNPKEDSTMPVIINDETYYRTTEACKLAGISRSTLLRWLRHGLLTDASRRDRRGWRLFTEGDVKKIEAEANRVKWTKLAK